RPGHARQRTLGRHGAGRRARAGRGRMHAAGRRSARRAPASQDPPMTRRRLATACALTALLAPLARFAPRGAARAQAYDLVLAGGRVLDPESGLDATRNVGVTSGRITAVTTELPAARETLDVRGLVVAPGFIDLHAHGQDSESYRYYAHDGVTTALELEIGTYPVAPWYTAREGRALINYGVTVGHPGARRALVLHDQSLAGAAAVSDTTRSWTYGTLAPADLPRLDTLIEEGIADGALGIGLGIAYTPGASPRRRCHHRGLPLHGGFHEHPVSGVRPRLARQDGHRLPRHPVSAHRRAPHPRQLPAAAPHRGRGRVLPHTGQHRAVGAGRLARHGGKRRHLAARAPAPRGDARARAGPLRARLERAQSDGRRAKDDADARP